MLSEKTTSDEAVGTEPSDESTKPSRRRGRVLLVLLLAVATGFFLKGQITKDWRVVHASGSGGPLDAGVSSTRIAFPVDLGQPFTFGTLSMHNEGDRPLMLESIRPMPPLSPGFRLVEVLVAQDPDRDLNSVGTSRIFPPTSDELGRLRPFHGAVVVPRAENNDRSTAVVMGLQLDRQGVFSFERIEVDYRVGSKPYTVKVDLGFLTCGPRTVYGRSCPTEGFFVSDDT